MHGAANVTYVMPKMQIGYHLVSAHRGPHSPSSIAGAGSACSSADMLFLAALASDRSSGFSHLRCRGVQCVRTVYSSNLTRVGRGEAMMSTLESNTCQ